jgi:4-amino-4-deoxy-L-arabinose transferase-like glycosyltransferase
MSIDYRRSTKLLIHWSPFILLFLLFWLTRLHDLTAFPFHIDEGVHVRWAVEVWNGHPFWTISDAKIIGHWPIALFYPQNAPSFVARVPTVMVAMLGLAAGCALAQRVFGTTAALLAGVIWLTSPYLFFYERLALPDAEAGATAVLGLWAAERLSRSGGIRDAALMGVSAAVAVLFKLTAAPYALMAGLVVLANGYLPLRRALRGLLIAGLAALACFAAPVAYILISRANFFSTQSGFIGLSSERGFSLFVNLGHFGSQLVGSGVWMWVMCMLAGFACMLIFRPRRWWLWLACALLPLLFTLLIGRNIFPRYYSAFVPTIAVLSGAGLGVGIDCLIARFSAQQARTRQFAWIAPGIVSLVLVIGVLPFMLTAYTNPTALPLSDAMREQNQIGPSAGFGLREAMESLPEVVTRRDLPIIASMWPDSCYRANFYARDGLTLTCADAPGLEAINAALDEYGAAYVLADYTPLIGIDVSTLDANATRLAVYPRPGETDDTATVVLWLLESE